MEKTSNGERLFKSYGKLDSRYPYSRRESKVILALINPPRPLLGEKLTRQAIWKNRLPSILVSFRLARAQKRAGRVLINVGFPPLRCKGENDGFEFPLSRE